MEALPGSGRPRLSDFERDCVSEEDRDLVRQVGVIIRSRNNTTRHVRESGLKIWMRQFAAYIAIEGNGHTRQQQLAMASRIARQRVSHDTLRRLILRPDFQALVEKLGADQIAATREKLQSLLPQVTDNLAWAMTTAREKEDYKAMPAVVEPILTRTIPKREEAAESRPSITVMIGGTFAKQYVEAEIQEPIVEELPPPETP